MSPRTAALLHAYVLHRYEWSESSLILDLFTREQGRIAVAAKGARRPNSQLRAVLLPFQHLQIALVRGRDTDEAPPEVRTLRSAEWAGGAAMLTGAALFAGFHCNELVMRFVARQDPHPELYDAYAETLPCLAGGDEAGVEAALRGFELMLLRQCGLLPDLARVTQTQAALEPEARYALLPETGVAAAGGAGVPGRVLIELESALARGSTEALRAACALALPELKAALRGAVSYHLGTASLRTRQVIVELQSLAALR